VPSQIQQEVQAILSACQRLSSIANQKVRDLVNDLAAI
jgi:hypothetical protein